MSPPSPTLSRPPMEWALHERGERASRLGLDPESSRTPGRQGVPVGTVCCRPVHGGARAGSCHRENETGVAPGLSPERARGPEGRLVNGAE